VTEELRKEARQAHRGEVLYLLSLSEFGFPLTQSGSGDIMDISSGGMRLRTSYPLENGQILRFPTPPEDIPAFGQVRWVGRDDHGFLAGIRFPKNDAEK
jgi:hypothetical protein